MVMIATTQNANGAYVPAAGTSGTSKTSGTSGTSTKTAKTTTPAWTPPAPNSVPFAQNPFTQSQLGQFGGVPAWMMQSYAHKIGQMGGNANNPNFPITPGGFPFINSPPVAPPQSQSTSSQATGGLSPQMQSAALGMLNGGLGASQALQSFGSKSAPPSGGQK